MLIPLNSITDNMNNYLSVCVIKPTISVLIVEVSI